MNLRNIALAAVAALAIAAPAKADVIFSFNQNGPNQGPGIVNLNGQIVVSDAAYASGFGVSLSNNSGSPYQASLPGLIGRW